MKKVICILTLVALWPLATSVAQVLAPNKAGVAMGRLQLIVRDVDAEKKVWIGLGSEPIKIDGTEVIKFPGVLIFLKHGTPSGGNEGVVLNHLGIRVLNSSTDLLVKLKADGLKVTPNPFTPDRSDRGYVYTTEGLRIEINPADKSQAVPFLVDHLHWDLPASVRPEVQAWYVKLLGAEPVKQDGADVPGMRLNFGLMAPSPNPTVPTKGKALDSIGFEVRNLEAYSKKLQASGVKFDEPYSKSRHKSFASVELTDPWGTSIELTEGLNRF